jgi:pimeloyl-ACP methyl ester carboxylesterase
MHMKLSLLLLTAGALSAFVPASVPAACEGIAVATARCSMVDVPENRTLVQARKISLRVAVVPARSKDREADPVFFLAGGPGQAATDLMRDPAILRNPLGERRDLVFFDQRGTGLSNPLPCNLHPQEDYAAGRFATFMPPDRVRACRRELEPRADLAQYTTAASVEDVEAVRKALGYEQINLAGGSYGTRLAMEYVRTYGSRVRTALLDGVAPPSLHMPDGFGRAAQRALDGILDECAATPQCSSAYPRLRVETREVFEHLARGPVTTRLRGFDRDITMTRDQVAESVRYVTYASRQASRLPMLLHQASGGDFTGIAEYLRNYRLGRLYDGLYLSITCAEDVPFVPKDAEARDAGTYLGTYRIREQRAACAEWPRGSVPRYHGEPVRSRVPVLITTGLLDPVTPPAHGDLVAQTLPNSVHIRVPAGAHGFGGLRGLDCLDTIRRDFVQRGSVKGLDTSCVRKIARPGFDIPAGGEVP